MCTMFMFIHPRETQQNSGFEWRCTLGGTVKTMGVERKDRQRGRDDRQADRERDEARHAYIQT